MRSIFSLSPVVRAVGVIGAVSVLATSVTFAAMQSTATLAENTVASGTADLVIDSNTGAGFDDNFTDNEQGFNFVGIIPGVTDSTVGSIKLRNAGDTTLDVKVAVPAAPVLSSGLTASMVHLIFHPVVSGSDVNVTLADLEAPGGTAFLNGFTPNTTGSVEYTVKASVDGTFSGEGLNVSGFDLRFTGTPTVE
jgi:hypothetical protein